MAKISRQYSVVQIATFLKFYPLKALREASTLYHQRPLALSFLLGGVTTSYQKRKSASMCLLI